MNSLAAELACPGSCSAFSSRRALFATASSMACRRRAAAANGSGSYFQAWSAGSFFRASASSFQYCLGPAGSLRFNWMPFAN